MTKKDYIALAKALEGAFPVPENTTPERTWRYCVDYIADALARDNHRFDRARFLAACGVRS